MNDLLLRAVMTTHYRYCGINVSYACLEKRITGSTQTIRLSIFLQQKSFLNKRFVLLKVDRNSEACEFLQLRTLKGLCMEDMELGNSKTVCIKDAAKDCAWDQTKTQGFGIFSLQSYKWLNIWRLTVVK